MSYAHGGGAREFRPVSIAVLTVSDSRDEQTDKSGRLLVERLTTHRTGKVREVVLPPQLIIRRSCGEGLPIG